MDAETIRHKKFAGTTRLLHWLSAVMIVAMIPIGVIMQQDGWDRSTQDMLFILHKNGGVILFLLVVVRLMWRAARPAPPLPVHLPDWQVRAAGFVQWSLYVMLLVMAISGYIRVRAGGFPIEMLDAINAPAFVPRSDALAETAQTLHSNARFVLVALIVLHIGAALRHALARDGVFSRIWPPVGRR
jgi:cytochrome b561